MELLLMVGIAVKGIVYCGYAITGLYLGGTGIRYYRDYKDSIAKERM